MSYDCPECEMKEAVSADVHEYRCDSCGLSWDSLLEFAHHEPQTDSGQQTLTSVATPGDQA